MVAQICRLCELKPPIKHSHIIPAFVCREIKRASPTGYLRSAQSPNKRVQDSDTYPLLCTDCENRFGKCEAQFNDHIFKIFRHSNQANFKYGKWLHYFITSVTWRTLIRDIEVTDSIPDQILSELKVVANIMRRYLLGENNASNLINNHAFFITPDTDLYAKFPIIRKCTGGYAVWMGHKFSAVKVNLAGFLCVTHIQLNPEDIWHNTKVYPSGGEFEQSQAIESWIIKDFSERMIELYKSGENLTEKQRVKIENDLK